MRLIVRWAAALCAIGALVPGSFAQAQDFPDKPLTLLLSASPGSSVDLMGRTIAGLAEQHLGQTITIINRPGGNGAAAMGEQLARPADGYYLWAATKTLPVALNTTLTQFSIDDFQPLVRVQVEPIVLAVRSDSPWTTLQEYLDAAKSGGDPINVGGFDVASPHALFNHRLAKSTGAAFAWVPFSSGSEAITALLGGHVDAVINNPSSLLQYERSGDVRILAVASEERVEAMADTPTFRELGVDLVDSQWRGLFLKAGTPEAIVAKLDEAFRKAIEDPQFTEYLDRTVQEAGYLSPADFAAFVKQEIADVETLSQDFQIEQ